MEQHIVHTLMMAVKPQDRSEYLLWYGMQLDTEEKRKSFYALIDEQERWRGNAQRGKGPQPSAFHCNQEFTEFVLLIGELEFVRRTRIQGEQIHLKDLGEEVKSLAETVDYQEQCKNNLEFLLPPIQINWEGEWVFPPPLDPAREKAYRESHAARMNVYDAIFTTHCLLAFLFSLEKLPVFEKASKECVGIAFYWFNNIKVYKELRL